MKLSLLTLLFVSLVAQGKAINIKVLSDTPPSDANVTVDLATRLFITALKQLPEQSSYLLENSSLKREWVELKNNDNICLYNKGKSPERERLAYFGRYPLIAFPPNRLIAREDIVIPESLSLHAAIFEYDLKVGVAGGRSYGVALDKVIRRYTDKITVLEGRESETRLREMLTSGRVDAIIEYSVVIDSWISEFPEFASLSYHELTDISEFAFGYVACSKTQHGAIAVEALDRIMRQETFFDAVLSGHRGSVPKNEMPAVEKALRKAFRRPADNP